MNLNSDHYPVALHIPHNTLIARSLPLTNASPTRILNPIPPENIEKFNITFFEENSAQIIILTTLLENHQHLSPDHCAEACTTFDHIVNKISQQLKKHAKQTRYQTLRTEHHNKVVFCHANWPENGKYTSAHTTS
jgi:hypothetical protein